MGRVMRLRSILLSLGTAALVLGCAHDAPSDEGVTSSEALSNAKPAEVAQFWKRYNEREPKSQIGKEWHEDNGGRAWAGDYLAWKESFVETSLIDMYMATRDVAFLDELVKRIDIVFDLRDDHLEDGKGRKDEVRGKVMPAWGRYPDVGRDTRSGVWVCEMVQNGLITYPIAEFVYLADNSQTLRQHFGDKIDRYRDRVVDTVDAFDPDWEGSAGFYRFPNGYAKVYPPHDGRFLPYNRALVMGRTMIMLEGSKVGDDKKAKYRDRVRRMARFFLDDARTMDGGHRYMWTYARWEQSAPEDASHGGLDTDFFAIAGKASYTTVGRQDIDRFIGTFENMSKNPSKIDGNVNGGDSGSDQKDANETCGRYLDLAAHDPKLATRCEKVIADGFDEHQAGYAKMLRYRR